MLFQRFIDHARDNALFGPGEAVLLAVSGGPDSVCLAHLFARAAGAMELRLGIAFVDHGWRDVKTERALVKRLAAGLDLPFHPLKVRPLQGDSWEARAREARLSALLTLSKRKKYARCALGHTRDDQAETVLMRLARGGGPRGLGGIRPKREGFWIHPLLPFSRPEVLAYLAENSLPWMEDPTNADPKFLRNRLRMKVLPLLERELNPSVRDALARAAEGLAIDDEFLTVEARKALVSVTTARFPFEAWDRTAFTSLHPALKRRLVAGMLETRVPRWEARQVDRCLAMIDSPRKSGVLAVSEGLTCLLTCDTIYWSPCPKGWPAREFSLPGRVCIANGLTLEARWGRQARGEEEVSLGPEPPSRLVLAPLSPGEEPLRRRLKALGVPGVLRPYWPVLRDGARVLWVPGWNEAAPTEPSSGPNMIVRWSHVARQDPRRS
jgi:tRNA(Ile)-lysidine synthase